MSGVREVLYRDLYRGVVTFGKVRRTGPKTRVKLPKDQWQTRQEESLRIVDQDLWDAAHARMATARNSVLRAADGLGRMVGHAEAIVTRYLLSGLLACGAHSDAPGRKPFCGSSWSGVGPGAWRFVGISRYDGALRGGLGRTAPADVLPGYGPRNDDVCRLMLHLPAEPNGTATEAPNSTRRESLMGLCTERRPARAIAGGSDAEGWERTGRVSSGPPM